MAGEHPSRWHALVSMEHRRVAVLGLLLVGLMIRVAFVPLVEVNGDTGLYLYDALQLVWGHTPIVEYPTRSPLMHALIAVPLAAGVSPISAAVGIAIAANLGLALATYWLGAEIADWRVGLAGMGLVVFTPYSILWGLWLKTEPVAGILVVTAGVLVLRRVFDDKRAIAYPIAVGMLFGAAFLVRRSVVAHAAGIGLFLAWAVWRQPDYDTRAATRDATLMILGGVTTLGVAYGVIAGGHPGVAWQVTRQHALTLFLSGGFGGLGWIAFEGGVIYQEVPSTGWIGLFCKHCGRYTLWAVHRIIAASTLLVALLVAYYRREIQGDDEADTVEWYGKAVFFAVVGGIALIDLHMERYSKAAAWGALFIAGVLVFRARRPVIQRLATHRLKLPLFIVVTVTAAYLYRDRVVLVPYFMELLPWLSIFASAALIGLWRSNRTRLARPSRRGIVAAVVMLLLVSGVVTASPFLHAPRNMEPSVTRGDVRAFGAAIDGLTDPGDRVFTAQPLFVIESDARIMADFGRKYYLYPHAPQSPAARRVTERLKRSFETGHTRYVIADSHTKRVLAEHPILWKTVYANYCPRSVPIFDSHRVLVLEYNPSCDRPITATAI